MKRKGDPLKLEKQKTNIIEAIKNGFADAELKKSMDRMIERREEIEQELLNVEEPKVLLHPNMSNRYKQQVENLVQALNH